MLTACIIAGCVNGIPDYYPPPPPPKPCDKVIVMYPERVAVCMTEDEFRRWTRRNMPQGGGW